MAEWGRASSILLNRRLKLPQSQPEGIRDPATLLYDCGNWAVSALGNLLRARRRASILLVWCGRIRIPQAGARTTGSMGRSPTISIRARLRCVGAWTLSQCAARAASEPHLFRRARRRRLFRSAVPNVGHDVAGIQPLRRALHLCPFQSGQSAHARGTAPLVQDKLQPSVRDTLLSAVNMVFNGEYPFIRWLESNGYDVSYFTGVDSDRRGEEILKHRLFLSVGHDEYWSLDQRRHVERARDAGVHLAFSAATRVFGKPDGNLPLTKKRSLTER